MCAPATVETSTSRPIFSFAPLSRLSINFVLFVLNQAPDFRTRAVLCRPVPYCRGEYLLSGRSICTVLKVVADW